MTRRRTHTNARGCAIVEPTDTMSARSRKLSNNANTFPKHRTKRISTGGRRRGAQADSLTRRGDTRRRETKSRRDKSPRGEVLTFLRAIGGALDADVRGK